MVVPRRANGTTVITVVISSGIISAVPVACTTRPAISRGNTGARPARTVPARNADIASTNTARSGSRVSSQPVNGMTTAMVSMNPVVSHWAVAAVTANSAMSVGRATDMMVSFRITTNAAATRRSSRRPVPGGMGGSRRGPDGVRSASEARLTRRRGSGRARTPG